MDEAAAMARLVAEVFDHLHGCLDAPIGD